MPATEQPDSVPLDGLVEAFRLRDHTTAWVATLTGVLADCPPILVDRAGLRIVDGHARVAAAQRLGWSHIHVAWVDGDDAALLLAAVRANQHGAPLTGPQRRQAAERLLRVDPMTSNRTIASACGLAQRTVAKIRATLQSTGEPARPPAPRDAPGQSRRGRDARLYPVSVQRMRKAVTEAIEDDPRASDREIARRVRCSPTTVGRVRTADRAREPMGLARLVDRFIAAVRDLVSRLRTRSRLWASRWHRSGTRGDPSPQPLPAEPERPVPPGASKPLPDDQATRKRRQVGPSR